MQIQYTWTTGHEATLKDTFYPIKTGIHKHAGIYHLVFTSWMLEEITFLEELEIIKHSLISRGYNMNLGAAPDNLGVTRAQPTFAIVAPRRLFTSLHFHERLFLRSLIFLNVWVDAWVRLEFCMHTRNTRNSYSIRTVIPNDLRKATKWGKVRARS